MIRVTLKSDRSNIQVPNKKLMCRAKFIFGLVLIIKFCIIGGKCNSQDITLDDMILIFFENDWQKTNSELISKGWIFDNIQEGAEDEGMYSMISWTYGKNNYEDMLRLGVLPNSYSRVIFHTSKTSVYQSIIAELNSHQFELYHQELGDYLSTSTYHNNLFELEIDIYERPKGTGYAFVLSRRP